MAEQMDYTIFAAATNTFEVSEVNRTLKRMKTTHDVLNSTYTPSSEQRFQPLPCGEKNFCAYCGRRVLVTKEMLECPGCGAPIE